MASFEKVPARQEPTPSGIVVCKSLSVQWTTGSSRAGSLPLLCSQTTMLSTYGVLQTFKD